MKARLFDISSQQGGETGVEQAAKCRVYSESDWLQKTIGTVGIVIKNYRIVGIIVEINL